MSGLRIVECLKGGMLWSASFYMGFKAVEVAKRSLQESENRPLGMPWGFQEVRLDPQKVKWVSRASELPKKQ
ncbi:MAG: hypothetical protein FJZ63_00335 [Chlamydiae bacterium]|nr:hypothetical protein [Chlamydiota bacterium]